MQKMLQSTVLFFLAVIMLGAASPDCIGQDTYVMNKADKKKLKAILGVWEAKNIEKDGRPIDIKAIAGEVYMTFSVAKEKDSKTKKTTKVNRWKMEIGGSDRMFIFNIKGDSIAFVGVKGWNDYRIINLEKDRLVVDQVQDGNLIRWNMVPKKKD